MESNIYEGETIQEIAHKIFYNFQVGQNCTVTGFTTTHRWGAEHVVAKGEMVKKELEDLDRRENCYRPAGDKRLRRRRKVIPDSIGGYAAQKIFKYKVMEMERTVKWMFWRIQ